MRQLTTEILVIGGGATGTGIVRDLAMRGFDAILVEARDLTHGTTGRFHGLLHSGGRYAVKDPQAARECIEENHILRRIMPHCIEDTGGFFVIAPEDDGNFAQQFVRGCQGAGIPVEEVTISQMLKEEPLLNPQITHCYRVPDGAADAFAAAHANVASAQEHGARVFNYHEVLNLLTADGRPQTDSSRTSRVIGALCHDLVKDEQVSIHADMVVNASGTWVGKIGATIGVDIAIRPGKGTMLAVSQRIVNTVINRCKMPSDGDILVPAHTVAVMGTTDEQVPDPDHFGIEPWEVELMLDEGEKMIPGFKKMRMLRAWAGVRPLYQETKTSSSRDITRSFVLLDHKERDGVSGLVTITSGKWTTYRKMAEETVDLVCKKLGTERECRTHVEELPPVDRRHQTTDSGQPSAVNHHYLGERLAHVEGNQTYGQLICECELATVADIQNAITEEGAKTLDDIRRDKRLGMGPCQGGFCTLRAAGILHQSAGRNWPVENTNVSVRDFLEERWKGVLPVLWGKQLHQERLNELIFLNVLGVNQLPGPKASRLAAQKYAKPKGDISTANSRQQTADYSQRSAVKLESEANNKSTQKEGKPCADVLVIGAGLSGLTAAWQTANLGLRTKLITKGWGATHWSSGCIDVLGYHPLNSKTPLDNPLNGMESLVKENPTHPYAFLDMQELSQALEAFRILCREANYPMQGSLDKNVLLPTALGALRPTCLAPDTMLAGDGSSSETMLLVGFERYLDFYPHFAAANLSQQGIPAEAVRLELPGLASTLRIDMMKLTQLFEQPEFRAEVAEAIKPHLGKAARVGFPAVLGRKNPIEVLRDLESRLGRRVFEMPGLPPSVPGIRLHHILIDAIRNAGGRVEYGMQVIDFTSKQEAEGGHIEAIWTEAAARRTPHHASQYVLATGGFLGDGFQTTHDGYTKEMVFQLPVLNGPPRPDWFSQSFSEPEGQPIFKAGVRVDQAFLPINAENKRIYQNVFAIGSTLAGGDTLREASLEGVALGTGFSVAKGLADS
jgi:glycerol-3-phosphate dehydrogenase